MKYLRVYWYSFELGLCVHARYVDCENESSI